MKKWIFHINQYIRQPYEYACIIITLFTKASLYTFEIDYKYYFDTIPPLLLIMRAIPQMLERTDAINAAQNLITSLNKGLLPPTETQLTQLYKDIHTFMSDGLQKSKQAGKTCIFTIGQAHQIVLGQNSLITQKMMMLIAKQLGITTLIVEGSHAALKMKQLMAPMIFEKIKKNTFTKIDPLAEVNFILFADPVLKSFNVIAGENDKNEELSDEEREAQIRRTIAKESSKGALLVSVGALHLPGVSNISFPEFKKHKLSIFPINTMSPKHSAKIISTLGKKSQDSISQFISDVKKTTSFFIEANFLSNTPEELLGRVDQVHKKFIKNKGSTSVKIPSKSHTASEILPVPAPLTGSLSTAAAPGKLPSATLFLPTTRSDATSLSQSYYPTETIPPLSVLLQIGFWTASKLGWCANPSLLPQIDIDTPFDLKGEEIIAAEKTLKQQGTSLQASLDYLFGKLLRSDTASKNIYIKFIVNVVNGNVDKAIGEKFNELAQISNAHARAKELDKLWRSVLKKEEKATKTLQKK